MTLREDDRRDKIAMHLGRHILELRAAKKLTMEEVKRAVDKAEEWMKQEQLRDDVARILNAGGDTRQLLNERLSDDTQRTTRTDASSFSGHSAQ